MSWLRARDGSSFSPVQASEHCCRQRRHPEYMTYPERSAPMTALPNHSPAKSQWPGLPFSWPGNSSSPCGYGRGMVMKPGVSLVELRP